MPKFLNDNEWRAVIAALECAAETYLVDATKCDRAEEPRIATQFRDQAKFARKLAREIQDSIDS